jgi:putative phosphoribosyl transferase
VAADMVIFDDRRDAGRKLAAELADFKEKSVVVLAIPNGGMPVAREIAVALGAELDVCVCRKIPIPLAPEGGMAAIADDGTMIVNDTAIKRLGLTNEQINYEAASVRGDIKQRTMLFRGERPPVRVNNRTVIIVDDGLASGVTMAAAVASLRNRRAGEIIVAAPVASMTAVKSLEEAADAIITCHTESGRQFFIADYYRHWHDVEDDVAVASLRDWRLSQQPRFVRDLDGDK